MNVFLTRFRKYKGKFEAQTTGGGEAAAGGASRQVKRRKTSAAGFFADSDDSDQEEVVAAPLQDELAAYLAEPQIKFKTEQDCTLWWMEK